ncbi:bifunctional 5,10-methylene-tetrahydrofolate dehydrogenase/5,10-methylene-tetrahydrofolate cyclohydrolase [bacterium]|nr:bifunctional 5,10-methylene-tetrahydrofolate dehydrogenase/5,10-methylene-tetrahydrofolate cyclohydrolase [bacterium]
MTQTPVVLDGKALAGRMEEDLKERVGTLLARTGRVPVLATILVGTDPASEIYVKMKRNACKRVGMDSRKIALPEEATTGELLDEIGRLNDDSGVCGILLQHPVPAHIDERSCFDRIDLAKDVDGVTCLGFGRMVMNEPAWGSATPAGIITLLDHYGIDVTGKRAVVVGRSPILGKPIAMMLLNKHATVTICHSRTAGLPEIVSTADIVVGALGKPEYIKSDWIRDGAVVIDAGYHKGGIGDIELDGIRERCGAYTPVPGGVGPMTIVTLISQTVASAERLLSE